MEEHSIRSTLSIVIIEDDPVSAFYVKKVVENIGHIPLGVFSKGEDAIQFMKENQADLLLIDVNLDGELNGVETINEISDFADVPYIFITAQTDIEYMESNRHHSPYGMLIKPFQAIDLKGMIRMAVKHHHTLRLLSASKKKEEEANRALKTLMSAHFQAQEEEKKKIAADIHDWFGQEMVAMNMQLGWLQKKVSDHDSNTVRVVEELNQSVKRITEMVHDFSMNLYPVLLDTVGVEEAIRFEVDHLSSRFNLPIECSIESNETRLDNQIKRILFRSVQELLLNVVKHANATKAMVRLKKTDHTVVLTVEDNGEGIKIDLSTSERMGLRILKQQIESIHGTLTIRSGHHFGTIMKIIIENYTHHGSTI